MTETPNNPSQTTDPLHLGRCPDCGYSLHGLPDRGLCPECGFAYDPDLLVLFGWISRGLIRQAAVRPGRMPPDITPMVPMILIALLIGTLVDAFTDYGPLLLPALLLVPLATGVYLLWRSWRKTDLPAPMQLRLSPRGFGRRTGWGPVTLKPWSTLHCVQIVPVLLQHYGPVSRYCCRISKASPLGFDLFGLYQLDFVFESTPETATRLQQRLAAWNIRSM